MRRTRRCGKTAVGRCPSLGKGRTAIKSPRKGREEAHETRISKSQKKEAAKLQDLKSIPFPGQADDISAQPPHLKKKNTFFGGEVIHLGRNAKHVPKPRGREDTAKQEPLTTAGRGHTAGEAWHLGIWRWACTRMFRSMLFMTKKIASNPCVNL